MKTPLYLYNSLSRKKELFVPLKKGEVRLYACGPTVYDYAHIGNFRSFLFSDILVRTLRADGYRVRYIQNITDVGHLTDDADAGDDKVEKAALEKGKSAQEIVDHYTEAFLRDARALNLIEPDVRPRATDHIKEQIAFIRTLEKKGFTYKTSDGIYFETTKAEHYGELASMDVRQTKEGARVARNPEKKHPSDFALWKFSPKGRGRQMEWDSPWGVGFPGWHIECSALGLLFLGFPFDIHTGGIDHREIHHTNEIAQNEGYYGKETVRYWLHNEFVTVDGSKMSKSLKNTYTLTDLKERGHSPLAFRYLALTTHYRQTLNFSWDALLGAENSYKNLLEHIQRIKADGFTLNPFRARKISAEKKNWRKRFESAIQNDLGTPEALAVLWDLIKADGVSGKAKKTLVKEFDAFLGLGLEMGLKKSPLPAHILELAEKREAARKGKDWTQADVLRKDIEKEGFSVEDTENGYRVIKKLGG